jgi:hypothetical protein
MSLIWMSGPGGMPVILDSQRACGAVYSVGPEELRSPFGDEVEAIACLRTPRRVS